MTEKKTNNLGKKRLILIVVLIILLISAFLFIQYKKTHISTDDAYITNDIYWVHPHISGLVKKVLINDNQYVKKGDILAVIDSAPYKIKLSKAEAEVALYKARLQEAKAVTNAIKSQINLTKARLDRALWEFNRAKTLLKSKVISKDKYEIYLTNYRVLKFDLQAKYSSLKQSLSAFKSAEKALNGAIAALNGARLNLSYTDIKAPAAGFVTKKGVEVGKFIAPQTPICALVPNENAWIVANYKESQLDKIKTGENVEITIDAYPDLTLKGKVESIQYGTGEAFSLFPPENASGNWIKVTQRVPVKIVFAKKPDVPLRVGMSVKTTILIK